MSKDKKIFLDKEDELEYALKRVEKAKKDKVILSIPEDSVLKSSLDNFHKIKEKADDEDKEVLVESTDPYIEELASLAGISASNPVFGKDEKLVSDIIPKSKKKKPSKLREEHEEEQDDKEEKQDKEEQDIETEAGEDYVNEKRQNQEEKRSYDRGLSGWRNWRDFTPKTIGVIFAVFLTLILIGWFALVQLPQADVIVDFNESEITFNETVTFSVSASDVELGSTSGGMVVPGELVQDEKNMEMQFSAGEERDVEERARGEIMIYNEFSTDGQILIEDTRFQTPNGLVYRINERVVVPGGEESDGEFIPGRISVDVRADEPGKEYNINSDEDEVWRIPGLQEAGLTERYNTMYGQPIGPMDGGFIGTSKVATDEDVSQARQEVESTILDSLRGGMQIVEGETLKFLEDAEEFRVLSEDVNRLADETGNFSVFMEGQLRSFAFRESDLVDAFVEKYGDFSFDAEVIYEEISYSDVSVNWDDRVMTAKVNGAVSVRPAVDKSELINKILGKKEAEVRLIFLDLPDLERARVSLWPFWVNTVPDDADRVSIEIQ